MRKIFAIMVMAVVVSCHQRSKPEMLIGAWKLDHIERNEEAQMDSAEIMTMQKNMQGDRVEFLDAKTYRITHADSGGVVDTTEGTYVLNPECTSISCKVNRGITTGQEFVNGIRKISEDTFILVSDRKVHLIFTRDQ